MTLFTCFTYIPHQKIQNSCKFFSSHQELDSVWTLPESGSLSWLPLVNGNLASMTQAEAWKTLATCTDFCCTWYPETTVDGKEPKLAHWRMKDEIPQREARWYRQQLSPLPKPATCQWCKWGQLTTETQVHPTETNRASPDGTLPVHRIHTHIFLFFSSKWLSSP